MGTTYAYLHDVVERLQTHPDSRVGVAATPLAGPARDDLTLPAIVKTGLPRAYKRTALLELIAKLPPCLIGMNSQTSQNI